VTMNNGIYYFAFKPNQFTTIAPLWEKIGGTFLTWEIVRNRFGRVWPVKEWKTKFFPRRRNLEPIFKQLQNLFPRCDCQGIRHHYLGPFPADLKTLICTSLWPIPPLEERAFPTFQFYHGVSDKRYKLGGSRREFPPLLGNWDFWMLPGEKERQKLLSAAQEAGINLRPEQLVKIGHLRFDKIINRQYNRDEIKSRAGIPDNGRLNILYAPTWCWGGGTLKSHFQEFCNRIPEKYNLIIRNHINDSNFLPVIKRHCQENNLQNVYFVDDRCMNFNDNMIIADLLITDSSSVSYDFLIMDRPIIFNKLVSEDVRPADYLYDNRRCGFQHDIEKDDIMKLIEASFATDQFKSQIREVRENCFYFLDGKATDRAIEFISKVLTEGKF